VRAAKRDDAEPGVVLAFLSDGASVDKLPGGNGRPDLLVGYRGRSHLVEVKTNRAQLRPGQKQWAERWCGEAPVVARTPAQARKWLAIWREQADSTRIHFPALAPCRAGCHCGEPGGGVDAAMEASLRPPPRRAGKAEGEPM
jgi:hypothetical protein